MNQVRLMFVDDHKPTRRLFETHARKMMGDALQFQEAPSAYTAMEMLTHSYPQPHAIIVDLNLGAADADGHTLVRDIRKNPQFSHIPVFTVSGNDGADYVKDIDGLWLGRLCAVVIQAAASYRPGPMDVLFAAQKEHAAVLAEHSGMLGQSASQISDLEATVEEGRGVVGSLTTRMDDRDTLTDGRHSELLDAIGKRPPAPTIVWVTGFGAVTLLGLGLIFLAATLGMNPDTFKGKYQELEWTASRGTPPPAPLDSRIESDGTESASDDTGPSD